MSNQNMLAWFGMAAFFEREVGKLEKNSIGIS
jgi:hypothetical protein